MTKKVTLISLFMSLLFSTTLIQAQITYSDVGYNFVLEEGLVQELNVMQEENGIQVTLRNLYADENRIIVEYHVSAGAEVELPSAVSIQLEDADGTLYVPYALPKDGGGGGDMGGAWMQELISYRVGGHWDTLDGNFIVTITVAETPFVFEASVPVNPAIRVIFDLITTESNMAMRLEQVSTSDSMTVATLCYILPNQLQAWIPRGTIEVMDASAEMLTQEPHARPNDVGESCFEMFVALPLTSRDGSGPRLSVMVEELVMVRPYTLDNLTELQTRAAEIGVRVEIFDNGSPIGYSYQFYDSSDDFPALVDDILYDHIVGPWTFGTLGLP